MPTGLTQCIGKGATFEEFVWGCARAFGALVTMRDDSPDAPIPERFEPHDYHAKAAVVAREQLWILAAMTPSQIEQACIDEYTKNKKLHDEARQRVKELRAKYLSMLIKINSWEPPSRDHEELKKFMIEQINLSIEFDCSYSPREPVMATPDEWRAAKRAEYARELDYHTEEDARERERVASRNKWLVDLRASVPPPTTVKRGENAVT